MNSLDNMLKLYSILLLFSSLSFILGALFGYAISYFSNKK